MIDRSEIEPKSRSFQLSLVEIGSLCHQYKRILDNSPKLFDYTFSSKDDIDWISREHDSENAAKQWKTQISEKEEFY